MNPFKELREWHIVAVVCLAIIGTFDVVFFIVKGIIWLFSHITIT